MYKSIETLRFLAGFLVFLCHYPEKTGVYVIDLFISNNLFSGAIGVDIFFIISGFVMYISASKLSEHSTFLTFWLGRIFRIFPLYLAVTFLYIMLSPKSFEALDIIKSVFFIPYLNNSNVYADPLVTLGWTLQFEMFFYVLVSLGIYFKNIIYLPIFSIILVVLLGFFYKFYFASFIIFEFLIGYLMALYVSKHEFQYKSKYKEYMVFTITCLLFLTASLGVDDQIDHVGVNRMVISIFGFEVNRLLIWGIPSALLVFSLIKLESKINWRISFLGNYTYSFYLLQIFPIALAVKLTSFNINPLMMFIFTLLLLFTMSYFSYHFFEKNFMKLSQNIKQTLKQ